MTSKLAGALVAGSLAVGILLGAAGMVVVHDATRPAWEMADMGQMMGSHGMGAMMNGGAMGSGTMDPADHARHHSGTGQ